MRAARFNWFLPRDMPIPPSFDMPLTLRPRRPEVVGARSGSRSNPATIHASYSGRRRLTFELSGGLPRGIPDPNPHDGGDEWPCRRKARSGPCLRGSVRPPDHPDRAEPGNEIDRLGARADRLDDGVAARIDLRDGSVR